MNTKDFRVAIKAAGKADGLEEGQFEAIVSVFGNEDSVGDVVMPGAFTKDLAQWAEKGDPLPVIWAHDWSDPFSHLGRALKAEERDEGLWIRAQIDDLDTNPKAAQVYRLLKGRRVTQFSFAYDVVDGGWGERDGQDVYELRELKVHEVGPCLLGANRETELLAVKAQQFAAGAKAGRVLSQKNFDRLSEAHAALTEVLAAAEPEKTTTSVQVTLDGKAVAAAVTTTSSPSGLEMKTDEPSQADAPATPDTQPDGAKSSEPATPAARRALAVARITQLS